MATLLEITAGHSQRISQLARDRDHRLQEAAAVRDRHLRALPAAARLYGAFDEQVVQAREKQLASDAKAEAARAGALQKVSEALRDALDSAQDVRREADVRAFDKRRRVEEDIEHEFLLAIAAAPGRPSTDAQKVRADKLSKAKKEFEEALAAAQEQFRQSRDAALIAESRGTRDANRSFGAAAAVSETSAKAARARAERQLAIALARLPEAAAEFEDWREVTAVIEMDYKREEAEEFERFHREMEALRT